MESDRQRIEGELQEGAAGEGNRWVTMEWGAAGTCEAAHNRQAGVMKTRIFAVLCVLTASGVLGQEREEPKPAPSQKPYAAAPAEEKPAAKVEAKTNPEDEMGIIEGIELARADGTFFGLQVVGGNFKLTAYDKKKKPTKLNLPRATARWNASQKTGQDFTVLNSSGDGTSLSGTKFVRPPYNFTVYLVLLNEAGEVVENYQVNMRQ